ncbi:unnamed protein product [Onchocerca flexuosa]|uniref:Secreted protein n=1 Tax=Onchocerca flexuosa TaxID=387005 RepID=A0A183HZP6_9BILA|nr:unnamed protein product [Onchocerca flexuosa]
MFLALIKGADESDGAFPITPAASGPNAPAQGDMVAIRNAVPKPPEQGGVADANLVSFLIPLLSCNSSSAVDEAAPEKKGSVNGSSFGRKDNADRLHSIGVEDDDNCKIPDCKLENIIVMRKLSIRSIVVFVILVN